MAEWTREINTDYKFPNIDILNVLRDGMISRYEAVPHEGYVIYDSAANDMEPQENPETGEMTEVPVTYYYTGAGFPLGYDFNNFSWKAVNADADSEEPDNG